MDSVLTVFGTRPEAIKFAPVIRALSRRSQIQLANICSSQHTDLLRPFIALFDIELHGDLQVMRPNQSLNHIVGEVVSALDRELEARKPSLVMVQGDTSTALAAAIAAFNRQIPVAHIEAGLRSGNCRSPYPEEMNRRLISQLASLHFAATEQNRQNLLADGIDPAGIHLTGNPVVDALHFIRTERKPSDSVHAAVEGCAGKKLIVLTSHRRENFGGLMRDYLIALREFVAASDDYVLLFPVHPNPSVQAVTIEVFGKAPRVTLLDPLDYTDFVYLLSRAWLVVSDSGGIQEEAPSLGKALLVLRKNTERPEAISAGVARLVLDANQLRRELDTAAQPGAWIHSVQSIANPFGDGGAAERIADCVVQYLGTRGDNE